MAAGLVKVRLQKFLADAGVASRRACEPIILSGRVSVNGAPARLLGTKVDPAVDRVLLDGQALKTKRKIYIALNKPPGYVCSRSDPEGRRMVGELLPSEWSDLNTVGRLDFKSEGLIFLTNDGELALRLTHPRYGIRKKYLALIEAKVGPEVLRNITRGVFHDGERLKAEKAHFLQTSNTRSVVELLLAEGKNREVRRLFEANGLTVARLQRVQIGTIKLGELPTGKWRVLRDTEVAQLFRMTEGKPASAP